MKEAKGTQRMQSMWPRPTLRSRTGWMGLQEDREDPIDILFDDEAEGKKEDEGEEDKEKMA